MMLPTILMQSLHYDTHTQKLKALSWTCLHHQQLLRGKELITISKFITPHLILYNYGHSKVGTTLGIQRLK